MLLDLLHFLTLNLLIRLIKSPKKFLDGLQVYKIYIKQDLLQLWIIQNKCQTLINWCRSGIQRWSMLWEIYLFQDLRLICIQQIMEEWFVQCWIFQVINLLIINQLLRACMCCLHYSLSLDKINISNRISRMEMILIRQFIFELKSLNHYL